MIRRIFLYALLLTLVAIIAACASPATPAPQAAATSGPAPTRTLGSVPPQPTSATLAPRSAVAFVSPTPAQLVAGGTPISTFGNPSLNRPPTIAAPGGAPAQAPAAAAPAPTQAPAAAAPAPTQAAAPASGGAVAPGVATGRRSEVKFVFLTPLKPAEEAEPPELIQLRAELKKVPGFLEVSDIDEGVGALVGYDAGLISVDQLIAKFNELKHPVKRQ